MRRANTLDPDALVPVPPADAFLIAVSAGHLVVDATPDDPCRRCPDWLLIALRALQRRQRARAGYTSMRQWLDALVRSPDIVQAVRALAALEVDQDEMIAYLRSVRVCQ